MTNRIKLYIAIACVLIVGFIVVYPKWDLYRAGQEVTLNDTERTFFIKKKTDLNSLALELKEIGIIDDVNDFVEVGEYKGLDPSKIAIGKYIIAPQTKIKDLLNGFTINSKGNGNAEVEVEFTFTFCSGIRQLEQMSEKVSKNSQLDSAKLMDYLNDSETLKHFGFTKEEFPAMFIPNTYKMFYDTDEKAFVDRMAREYRNFWNQDRRTRLAALGLSSPSQLYTLASIVYSEQSRIEDEWPVISKLYLNRLNSGEKLQSDPTFKFCWGDELDGVQRLLYEHRDIDCPYNTYKNKGLPPGPICLVSSKVLDAVLNPVEVDYIFMCARPDYSGRHNFTKYYREHAENARKFQRWIAEETKNTSK